MENVKEYRTTIIITTLITLLPILFGLIVWNRLRRNIHKKPLTLTFWIIPVMSVIVNGITYAAALGMEIEVGIIISILVGILLIALGNYMPKLQQNYTIGIRVPWTLNSTENWNRTHRLGGKTFILGGFLLIITGFL